MAQRLRIGAVVPPHPAVWVSKLLQWIRTYPGLSLSCIPSAAEGDKNLDLFERFFGALVNLDYRRNSDLMPGPGLGAAVNGDQEGFRKSEIVFLFGPAANGSVSGLYPPLGFWRFRHGNCRGSRLNALFWDLYTKAPIAPVVLECAPSPHGPWFDLSRTCVKVDDKSPARHEAVLGLSGLLLAKDMLSSMHAGDLDREVFWNNLRRLSKIPCFRRKPNLMDASRWILFSMIPALCCSKLQKHFTGRQWGVGITETDPLEFSSEPMRLTRWHFPAYPDGLADPFPIEREGKLYIFAEHEDANKKGTIVVIETDGVDPPQLRTVLEARHHLSFPCLIEAGDSELFMVPEQSESEKIQIYRCSDFPLSWQVHSTILEGVKGVDPVILRHNGYWWLFVTRHDDAVTHNNLYLYYSSNLDSGWIPHRSNPIRVGVVGSRMAGAVLRRGGRLFRFGQKCLTGYGKGVVAFTIKKLTPEQYEEEWYGELDDPSASGVHTLNYSESYAVIDSVRPVLTCPRFKRFSYALSF